MKKFLFHFISIYTFEGLVECIHNLIETIETQCDSEGTFQDSWLDTRVTADQ
jgi:hypothetical protein